MAAETERSSHKVYEKDKIGEVQIADEVVAIIAWQQLRLTEWIPWREILRTSWLESLE